MLFITTAPQSADPTNQRLKIPLQSVFYIWRKNGFVEVILYKGKCDLSSTVSLLVGQHCLQMQWQCNV